MEESADVRAALLRFYDRLSAKDVASFDQLVSSDPATMVIGTAPGELVSERAALRYGFEAEGIRLEGIDPKAYEEGSLGWAVDQPNFVLPDGSSFQTRLTAVMHREDSAWKLIHAHFSVGVPDEEVVDLQKRWSS